MSDLLSTMEHEYKLCCRKVDDLLNTSETNTEAREQQLTEARQQLEEADLCVKQMEVEIEGSNIQYRSELKQKLRTQKKSLEQLRKRVTQVTEEFRDHRIRENVLGPSNEHQRQKLIQQQKNEERLFQQSMKLQEAKITGYACEKDAANIQMELHRHSDMLQRDIEKTRMTNQELTESNVLLKRMKDRIRENRMVLYVVIGVVTLAVSIVAYSHTK